MFNLTNNNQFIGYYIQSDQELNSLACPMNGEAILCVNMDTGKMYAKKMINGVPVINSYEFKPIESKDLLQEIEELKKEIIRLKEAKNESDGNDAFKSIKK